MKENDGLMNITIRNCNAIDTARIQIDEHKLNIKYAMNGAGKSTIARAIDLHIQGNGKITALIPFKHLGSDDPSHTPSVSGLDDISSIAVFNDAYINQFAFQQDEVLANSFDVFVKSPGYDTHIQEIETQIAGIKATFRDFPEIDRMIGDLAALEESFGKAKSGYSEAGSLAKGIGKGNKVANIPKGLESYGAYLKSPLNSKWIKWQTDGNTYTSLSDNCPFCTNPTNDKKDLIAQVGKEFDAKSIEHLNKIISLVENLGEYFSAEAKGKIGDITRSISPLSKEAIAYLLRIKQQIELLKGKLLNLKGLSYFSMKDVEKVAEYFVNLKIDLTYLPELNSTSTSAIIDRINGTLENVLTKVGLLQGEVAKQNRLIKTTIEENQADINTFLRFAGYKYYVEVEYSNASYKMRLRHSDYTKPVESGDQHLSYGEKNAFSLVLFMYECLSKNPDLIVLDDPISSFDRNKKYAVLDMLFRGQKSLQDKTVLMMTHDLEPVIDILYNLRHKFSPLPVASFFQSGGGSIVEVPITREDISTFGRICDENISKTNSDVVKLVYLRRYYEVLNNKGLAYQLLSNLLKKRAIPFKKEAGAEIVMSDTEIIVATKDIQKKLPSFDYSTLLAQLTDLDHMRRTYIAAVFNYEKLQLFRVMQGGGPGNDVIQKFINETFHIENEYVMQINPCKYEVVPTYIVEECNKVVLAEHT